MQFQSLGLNFCIVGQFSFFLASRKALRCVCGFGLISLYALHSYNGKKKKKQKGGQTLISILGTPQVLTGTKTEKRQSNKIIFSKGPKH